MFIAYCSRPTCVCAFFTETNSTCSWLNMKTTSFSAFLPCLCKWPSFLKKLLREHGTRLKRYVSLAAHRTWAKFFNSIFIIRGVTQRRGVFLSLSYVSGSLQRRISGQRLMMQRRHCASAVEQKSHCRSFLGPRQPETKTPTQPGRKRGHCELSGLAERRRTAAKGGVAQMSCISYEI